MGLVGRDSSTVHEPRRSSRRSVYPNTSSFALARGSGGGGLRERAFGARVGMQCGTGTHMMLEAKRRPTVPKSAIAAWAVSSVGAAPLRSSFSFTDAIAGTSSFTSNAPELSASAAAHSALQSSKKANEWRRSCTSRGTIVAIAEPTVLTVRCSLTCES